MERYRQFVVDALDRRLTTLLATSAIGVYHLVLVGAGTSLLGAGTACSGWPTCAGGLLPPADPMAVVAWGHRAVGLVVGLVLIATVVATWLHASKRVAAVVSGAALLYPLQTDYPTPASSPTRSGVRAGRSGCVVRP